MTRTAILPAGRPLRPAAAATSASPARTGRARTLVMALALPMALAACHAGGTNGAEIPGDRRDTQPYEGVAPDDILRIVGTEPFWSGEIRGETMIWKTPERPEGQRVALARFNGRGGFSYSGTIDGTGITMAVTPGACSDGMSDRTYPFVVTLQMGEAALRHGCGWSGKYPFEGDKAP
ncbi:COG3650 family protein [Sphingobium lignivorans]|uniref:Membrane protein n=1 Tax=Sphingobium lignivorans TaxID=2735886 RepID=A0ABR6NCU9_9SPHN|nr:hypothetical protein [Sphingobium lignivorans]MBB5984338.1 putative membrane protein [Sphingobium lignivorans]